MSEQVLQHILTELQTIKAEQHEMKAVMATKQDLEQVRSQMATKQDLEQVHSQMATKDDLEQVRKDTKLDIERLESQMATKQDLEQINHKLDSVIEQTVKNAEDITLIKEVLASTADSVALLVDSQKRQDKILDALSARSLEQEAELNLLKRMK